MSDNDAAARAAERINQYAYGMSISGMRCSANGNVNDIAAIIRSEKEGKK